MATKYKLTYFNLYGRGEAARLLFALAGVEYEDERFEYLSDEWKQAKSKTLFGQLPQLEIDGRPFCQSIAITRYLANKFGFAGKTELDKLQADMIVDCLVDLTNPLDVIFDEEDETKKERTEEEISRRKAAGSFCKSAKNAGSKQWWQWIFCWRFGHVGGLRLGWFNPLDFVHEDWSNPGKVS